MKALKLTPWILIMLIFSSQKVSSQDTLHKMSLSFDQALEITLKQNPGRKQTLLLEKEKEQAEKAAFGLHFPKIGISANYSFLSDPLTLDLNPVKDAITPLYSTLGNYGYFSGVPNPDPLTHAQMPILPDSISTKVVRNKLNAGLAELEESDWNQMIQKKQFGVVSASFTWPLYTGGKISAANKAARIEHREATEISRQKEGELTSELVERYFGLCLAMQAVNVRTDVYNGMKKHLDDAEKLHKDGFIANVEVLQAKLSFAQADRELKKSKRQLEILNEALGNTLAIDQNQQIEPLTALFYLDTIEPLSHFTTMALAQNPLLRQVQEKQNLAEQNYKLQKAEYFPMLAMTGTYDIANQDLSPYMPDWMVGVGLKWTIFDGTSRYRKVQAASYKTGQVNEIKLKAQADIETLINKLYHELYIYSEQLKELESARELAEEYVRIREKAFHEEMSNATELIDARMALAQVRIERLQAIYNYDLTLAKLLQYTGVPEQFDQYRQKPQAKTEKYQPIIK